MELTDEPGGMDLREYVAVLRRRRWIVIGVTVIAVATALAASYAQTKVYATSAELLLQPRASEQIFSLDGQRTIMPDRTILQTEIEVMQSRSVREAVEEELGFRPDVSISARGDTKVVVVRAEHPDPALAAKAANTYARVYIATRRTQLIDDLLAAGDQVQAKIEDIDAQLRALDQPLVELEAAIADAETTLERLTLQQRQEQLTQDTLAQRQALQAQRAGYSTQLGQLELSGNLTQTGGAQLVSEAFEPGVPVRPTPRRNSVIALVLGLMLGGALAYLRDYLDDSVRAKDDLERATGGLPVLGLIPAIAGWKERERARVVSISQPMSPGAEAYRTLRTSVQFMGLDRPLQLIQVTSAHAGEGKTTTLANLAVALGQAGQNVLVVCCDLRRPRLHEFFDCDNRMGFTSLLMGDAPRSEIFQPVPGQPRLRLLASGPIPPNPSELLSSARARDLFEKLKQEADVVLVDSPPVLPVTDGLVLAGVVDATIVVSAAGRTSRKAVQRTLELLRQVNAPVVGTVLNGVKAGDGYGYGYGYGYGSHGTEAENGRDSRKQRKSRERAERAAERV